MSLNRSKELTGGFMTNVKIVRLIDERRLHFKDLPHWTFFERDGELLLKVGDGAYKVDDGLFVNVPGLTSVQGIRNVSVCLGGE